jgi:hypothetical protein
MKTPQSEIAGTDYQDGRHNSKGEYPPSKEDMRLVLEFETPADERNQARVGVDVSPVRRPDGPHAKRLSLIDEDVAILGP